MLEELTVSNLGVIEYGRVTFGDSMNVLTGETGAGKTLVVGAIQLLLGAKGDSQIVRSGADAATVTARIVDDQSNEFIVERSVLINGRSRAYIDGKAVTMAQLEEFASEHLEVHGQHAAMKLGSQPKQLRIVDLYGKVDTTKLQKLRSEWREKVTEIERIETSRDEIERQAAIVAFEISEISKVAIKSPTEDTDLELELNRLESIESYRELFSEIIDLCDGQGATITGKFSQLLKRARALSGTESVAEILETISTNISELYHEAVTAVDDLEFDPNRVEEIRHRLMALRDIKRRYGPTLRDVTEQLAKLQVQMESFRIAPEDLELLRQEAKALEEAIEVEEASIADERRRGADLLCAGVNLRLGDLALSRANLSYQPGIAPDMSTLLFYFQANPGLPPVELAKCASGGELSRLMLAISLEASKDKTSLLFDEVDAGVGGQAGVAIGRALQALARDRQVIVVTHLAQVAAFASTHFYIDKVTDGSNTRTEIVKLTPDGRIDEIARMLSGHGGSTSARAHAKELIEASQVGSTWQ
ncbi:MAG: DNA repair protein RecN [Actinomycetota bacterium]|nr:DNA repair protein RecN [Actinomycetota bacterium]